MLTAIGFKSLANSGLANVIHSVYEPSRTSSGPEQSPPKGKRIVVFPDVNRRSTLMSLGHRILPAPGDLVGVRVQSEMAKEWTIGAVSRPNRPVSIRRLVQLGLRISRGAELPVPDCTAAQRLRRGRYRPHGH
jgi:hypothetical protein